MPGRGIDFEHRFNTSRWAENLLLESLCDEPGLLAVRFGLSQVRPPNDVQYDKAAWKEPDLLVYRLEDLDAAERKFLKGRDLSTDDHQKCAGRGELAFVTRKASAAIEVEFSPYKASEMAGRNWKPKTSVQWERRPLKHATPPIAPNIWVKEEDLARLNAWGSEFDVPIIVAHLFDQEAFAIPLCAVSDFDRKFARDAKAQIRLQMTTGIFKKEQSYDRVDAQGAGEKKVVFVITPAVALKIGEVDSVRVQAQLGLSTSKKYVTHCLFSGGHLKLTADFVSFLKRDKNSRSSVRAASGDGHGRVREDTDGLTLWPESGSSSG